MPTYFAPTDTEGMRGALARRQSFTVCHYPDGLPRFLVGTGVGVTFRGGAVSVSVILDVIEDLTIWGDHAGVWYEEETHTLYVDRIIGIDSYDHAIAYAKDVGEIAIFDRFLGVVHPVARPEDAEYDAAYDRGYRDGQLAAQSLSDWE